MDKRTILAVVLSVVIMVAGFSLQSLLFPQQPAAAPTTTSGAPSAGDQAAAGTTSSGATAPAGTTSTAGTAPASSSTAAGGTLVASASGTVVATPDSAPPATQPATIQRETDLLSLTFAAKGAAITSVKLKQFRNLDGSLVEMVLLPPSGAAGKDLPFGVAFGPQGTAAIDVPFTLAETREGPKRAFTFSRTFLSPAGVPFTLRKQYVFADGEYLFQLRVSIENSVNDYPALDFGGFSYTLAVGPQIGPQPSDAGGRVVNDGTFTAAGTLNSRTYAYYEGGKGRTVQVGQGQVKTLDAKTTKAVRWAAITGKYFTVLAAPDSNVSTIVFDSVRTVSGFDHAAIALQRATLGAARATDTYFFYAGPLKGDRLSRYNQVESNAFGLSDLHAESALPNMGFFSWLGWLTDFFKIVLDFLARMIPNYGVAIILLTLLTKIVLLPLTYRSSEGMAKMASLNPKMTEIRERLKGKPEQMNQAIAELYRKEKINPLSGCLPLLLQFPIFIALYNLLNNDFEIRGAMFIPGWIPDLSMPDTVLALAHPVTVLFFTFSGLHLLPIIMVVTQVFATKFTQPTGATPQSSGQQKLMMYGLPIIFFFILYEMPSGLVLYWTAQNVFSTAQQLYINWHRARRAAGGGGAAGGSGTPQAVVKPSGKNASRPALKTSR